MLTELVSSDRRGSFLNLSIGMGQIGSGVGGGLAGVVYAGTGYEGTTAITAVAMVGIGFSIWLLLPETRRRSDDGSASIASADRANAPRD